MRGARTLKRIARPTAVLLLAGVLLFGWRWGSGNFSTILPGELYRSAQLGPGALTRKIEDYQIQTVLNLRGPNPETNWYRDERIATISAGATQIDVAMSSDYWLTREQALTLIDVLDTCERPILIHCQFGAERTGLVSAFAELLRPGSTLADARAQFSVWYLFLPLSDGKVMLGHLNRYEQWLKARSLVHNPDWFRHWVREEYEPGIPSRDNWPYDPYPLKVVTRPESAPQYR